MAAFFLRGVLIGLLFGVPAGAVGTMTVQRTWNYGIKAGLFTGLGSSVADCIYACVGAFGLTVISKFLSSFLVGITNPAAVLTFLFAFSYFGISGDTNLIQGICLVIGVFLGTYLWWAALSVIVNILKGRQKKDHLQIMNRIFGVILCLFGMVVFIRIII